MNTKGNETDVWIAVEVNYVNIIEINHIANCVAVVPFVSTIRKGETAKNAVVGRLIQGCPDCGGYKICNSKSTIGCRTTGNRKINGYCSHCFANLFPEALEP